MALSVNSVPSFAGPRLYATGDFPVSVAIGDLNGDGNRDVVTANRAADTVSVLLNRGDGSFQAKVDYRTGLFPTSVAIGDLNGDGRPDLATTNANAMKISVLLNRGDGSFQPRRDYSTGRRPWAIAVGDLNGDGKPDVTTVSHCCGTVSVLLNRGDGRFGAKRDYEGEVFAESVAIVDATADGKPDLVVPGGESSVSVLAKRGDGSFQPKVGYPTSRRPSGEYAGVPLSVAAGDLNGDGKPDLVTANITANTVSVLINTPGLCAVQNVVDERLGAAKRAITRAGCGVGKISRAFSNHPAKGNVISQEPRFGAVLPIGSKVNLVVSRGQKG
jgi:FG-GAP-like repeat/PASTA domain